MIRAALLTLLARASAAHNRALLAAAASCPGDGEDLVVGSDELMAVAEAVGETPLHDNLRTEWRRNANDYARAVTDLEYVETVGDFAVVGGWDS